jgi:cytochrome c553
VKKLIGILVLALAPTLAAAAEKPDWAFVVSDKVQPTPRIAGDKLRTAPGGTPSITRAQADEIYNVPDWRPDLHPPMPKIVQFGNKDTQVRACGACHLPTGTGHDESAYVAGLTPAYFIRQMQDWKTGDRKYSGTMVAMAKIISDAEIKEAADYFASLKPRQWIRVVEAATVPKSFVGPGNKRLASAEGGTEPIANRIIEIPEDEEVVLYRDPSSGFVAYVPPGSIAKGEALVKGGASGTQCARCHGEDLKGRGQVPRLAGLQPLYIARQLFDMQYGSSTGGAAALMKPVVANLSEDDIIAISSYLGSLPPQ